MFEPDPEQPNTRQRVEITAEQLPLHCPPPGKRLWDSHPKVYLPMQNRPTEHGNEQTCPYCGTVYVLVSTAAAAH